VVVNLSDGTARGSDYLGTDRLSGIENVVGSASNDQIIGNAGVNQLQGAWGADVLVGGGGADRFVYYSVDDSYAESVDLIRDFSRSQGDKISLNIIDANEQVDGNQAFQFIGQKQFTGAGQLRFFQENGDTVVEANITDATAGAELRIEIDLLVNFQATDFVL
jgi:Ca2+-binding RTX toxin-like protein